MLLIAGGGADPNIALLARRAALRGVAHRALIVPSDGEPPRLAWRLDGDTLTLDGVPTAPTALFLRHDVFAHLADGRAETALTASRWYQTLLSWGLAHPAVAMPNRGHGARQTLKPLVLMEAMRAGLAVPETLVTNDPASGDADWITKPVNGGALTRPLGEARADPAWVAAAEAAPTLLQPRLVPPELRIYRIGRCWLGFSIRSAVLDYRAEAAPRLALAAAPPALTGPLGRLMDRLGLDFGAADFKTCAATGRWLFLEVNSAPMFVAFDRVSGTAVTDAILDWLAPRAS